VSTDTGLLKEWPTEGPPLLWESKGAGRGYSSLAITGGRIYTVGDGPSTAEDKDEYLLAFDEASGQQVWKAKLGAPYDAHAKQESWNSSRSTPTVDGELIYVLTGTGNLICLETAQGKERWRKSMQKDLGGKKGDGWGYSESPLVDGDHLVCTPGGGKSTLVCLNKLTGETVWTAASSGDGGAGHASIVPSAVGPTRVYVTTTSSGALGVRASDGKVLWTYPFKATAVIPTPIVKGDLVFCGAGYKCGCALLKQVPTPEGGVKIEEVYGLKLELRNKHGGIVLVGDYLYADTDGDGMPWCADFMTGTQKWVKRGSGRGSAAITAADGHLFIRYQSGQMVLANASPEEYKETGSFKIPHNSGRPSWSHPVVSGQKLFLREGDYLLCYDLKAK
jgi:outer membrane protein assembly factor BamB